MKKLGEQISFQQAINFIDQELNTIQKKPTFEKLEQVQPQLNKLNNTIAKLQEKLLADRRLNRTDVRNKLEGLRQERDQVKRIFQEIKFKLQKDLLTKRTQNQKTGKFKNLELLDQLQERNVQVQRGFQTAAGLMDEAKNELVRQRPKIHKLNEQWQESCKELTMIDQFMRMISNRNLLTKIMLILLAIFLGLADIAVIVFKIS